MARRIELRWIEYAVRALLVLLTVCSIGWSWLALQSRPARRECEAAAAIEKLGGRLQWTDPAGPGGLPGSLVGDDFNGHVIFVGLEYNRAAGTALEHLEWLDQVENLALEFSSVSDADLERLRGLKQLERLNLTKTQVTDAGLKTLKGLNQLQCLCLGGTSVTKEALAKLQQELPNCKIER